MSFWGDSSSINFLFVHSAHVYGAITLCMAGSYLLDGPHEQDRVLALKEKGGRQEIKHANCNSVLSLTVGEGQNAADSI